ncbi:hypothetical protein PVL29_013258 [Vitis rotundifolia]|uniref:Uncharacterized protein n=1 Tax=Vitis rotundifolia TaxID=103349 RepID=A0AA38ZMK6_VITRO|nr:hypothetical protein PVL29_013258 [Vitis rotundifolia]
MLELWHYVLYLENEGKKDLSEVYAWCLLADMDDMVDDDTLLVEVPTDMDVSTSSSEHDAKTSKLVQENRPHCQIFGAHNQQAFWTCSMEIGEEIAAPSM